MAHVKHETATDFEAMIRRHQSSIWAYLRYLGATRAESDDLTQETFLALMRSQFEDRGDAASLGYLRQIARNQLLMLRRRQGTELDTIQLEVAEDVWAKSMKGVDVDHFLHALQQCRDQLTGRAKQVVDLFYGSGLRREQVASKMQMTAGGIKTLLRRTREALRNCVERETGQ